MKKFVFLIVALFGISFAANAQTGICKVSNTVDATVAITVESFMPDGTVVLSINSDAEKYVNVQFQIKYKTEGGYEKTSQTFTAHAQPCSSTTKTVKILLEGATKVKSIIGVKVSGARCQ